jgi:hypothetical protein
LQTNFLIIHGSCTTLALNVECPYFVQEILLGAAFIPGHEDQMAAVARLIINTAVSERDKAFVRTVAGPEEEEWWYGDDEDNYPMYEDPLAVINAKVHEVYMDFSA